MNIQETYGNARLNHSLTLGKSPALIVIDLVNGFTNPKEPLGFDLSNVIHAANQIIQECRTKSIPIIFCTIAYNPNLLDGGLWISKVPAQAKFIRGSEYVKLDKRLYYEPANDIFMEKKYASSFFGTELLSTLNSQGIDTLIVTGTSTSGCIRATVVDAIQCGFLPVIPREAVGDRANDPHEASLFDIKSKYGEVIQLSEVINYIKNIR